VFLWTTSHPKQAKKALHKVSATITQKKDEEKKEKPSKNQEDAPFVTTIIPHEVSNPHHVSFAMDTVSREDAEKEVDETLMRIGTVVPREFVEADLGGLIANYRATLDQAFPTMQESKKQQLMSSFILEHYQGDRLVEESNKGKISWQAMQVAGLRVAQEADERVKALTSDDEYLKIEGFSKADNFIGKTPHPYDDPEGHFWKTTEIFQQFPVPKITKGLITTEQELYRYIDPDKIAQAMEVKKEMEAGHDLMAKSLAEHKVTNEEFNKTWDFELEKARQEMRTILTNEERKILGWEN
jgi:hypothetical protein